MLSSNNIPDPAAGARADERQLPPDRVTAMLDHAVDGVVILDPSWRFTYANQRAAEILNQQRPDDLIGQVVWAAFPDAVGQPFQVAYEQAMRVQRPASLEARVDRTDVWFEHRLIPSPSGLMVLLSDISARKRAEAERAPDADELRRLNQIYATLGQINRSMVMVHDRDALFRTICRIVIEYGQFRMAWVGLVSSDGESVLPAAYAGAEQGYLSSIRISLVDPGARGPSATAVLTGRCVATNRIADDPLMRPWREVAIERGYQSMASVPLLERGRVIGVLNVYAAEPDQFDREQVQLLEEISLSISFTLDSLEQEEALRESEERFRSFIAQSTQGMMLTDEQGVVIEWNRAMERISEIPRAAALGRLAWDVQHEMIVPERRALLPVEVLASAMRDMLARGEVDPFARPTEVPLLTPSGERKIIEQSAFPIHTAKGYRIGAILQDISERTRAQGENRRLLSILEQAHELVASADTTGAITYINARGRAMLGIPSDTPISDYRVTDFYPEGSRDYILSDILPEAERRGHWEGETTVQSLDGALFPAWQDVVVHYAPDGSVSQYSTIVSDITERRRTDLERQALVEILQVLASTDDLQETLRLIHRAVGRVIYAENFLVVFYNEETGLFEEVYSVDEHDVPGPPSRMEKSLTAYVFRTMAPLLVTSDVFADLRARGEVELIGQDSEAWLGAPLAASGKTVGVMAVQNYQSGSRYSERDRSFLASIAAQVALALRRKHDQDVLRFEEERFRELAENIQEGFWMYDQALQRTLYVSPAYAEMLGRAYADVQRSPYDVVVSVLPADREVVLAAVEQQALGQRTEIEYRVRRPDGSTGWIWDRSFPILSEDGEVLRSIGIATDITDLKQAREQLEDLNRTLEQRVRESTAETQDLYENAPAGYHSLDTNGVFTKINQTELAWLGYTREEIVGRMAFRDILAPASQPTFLSNFPHLKALGRLDDVELELVRKDGSTLTVVASATSIYDASGAFVMTRSTMFDITARRQAEQALRQSQHSLQNFLDTASDLIQRLDQRGNYLYVNNAWLQTLGYTAAEAAQMGMFDVLAPEYHAHCMRLLDELTTTGQPQQLEVVFRTKDGRAILVEGSVSGDVGPQGQPITNGIFRDITIRKQAEDVLRQSRDELHAVNAELARASRMKDEFLSNMSHELRTPLNGILSLSESLEEGVYGPLSPPQVAPVRGVVESGRHLLSLITDILDLSKIEAGKMTLQLASVSIESISQGSLRLIQQPALQKRLQLIYDTNCRDLTLQTDERRVKQILVNLLSNAVKFTPEGGQIGLRVALDPAGQQVRFEVWDTGIGIAPDKLPLLFRPFIQVDSSITRQYSGTGLGLSLVRRLTELIGGSVGVESEPGSGSRFSITLPVRAAPALLSDETVEWLDAEVPAEPTAPARAAAAEASGRAMPLILLAEDNLVNQESMSDYLTAKGFGVSVAASGIEALERAVADQPDLILMDIQMPQMDGLEATRQLRAMPAFAATPIIALTALAMPGDRERCIEAGATEYMTKPVSFRELAQLIRDLLGIT
jgi:PAS domain S-box-containing protein